MIQLTKGQIEFKYSFKAIKELMNLTKTELKNVGNLSTDLNNIPLIAYVGHKNAGGKLSQEEIETMLDEGNFKDIKAIASEYGKQIVEYFGIDPNEKSQSPLTA